MHITSNNITADDQLIGFRIHDANVIGLFFEDRRDFIVTLRRSDQSQLKLVFGETEMFGIVGFRNGTIVSDIFIWKLDASLSTAPAPTHEVWRVLIVNHLGPSHIPHLARRISSDKQKHFLVQVVCSYGGPIAVLCRSVEALELPR